MRPGNDGRYGHYLRPNDKVWTPPAIICLDSEAYRTERDSGEDQTLRLWCARMDDRRRQGESKAGIRWQWGTTGTSLADTIDAWCKGRETIWLYAHNLGYDLTLTQLVELLCDTGWTVTDCSATPEYLFLMMQNGRKRLTLTDSHHILPTGLATIGGMIGTDKMRMPADDASDDEWRAYCANDVDILATTILLLMQHWDDYRLGTWSLTGAASGWHAMRHMLKRGQITLFKDDESSAIDRKAIYGGRRYCWRHGPQPMGRYSELDFTAAHATTAANYPMPVKRGPVFDSLDINHSSVDSKLAIIIAECEIETDTPRFPVKIDDRVWYPVGRFRTTLASPEIAYARALGCLKSIGRGQFHYTSHALANFFARVLDIGDPSNESWHPLVRAMWKQWGRSVIGKFAQHGWSVTDTGMLTHHAWHYERAIDYRTGKEYWLVHYGGHIYAARESGDSAQAYPAVLATVESYERVALAKAAAMLGDTVIIQCDTDGLWADMTQLEAGTDTGLGFPLSDVPREIRIQLAIECIGQQTGALQLRQKHHVNRIAVYGPQNYDAGQHSKQSGRPARTREIRPGIWAGEAFPAVSYQMTRSAPGVYRTEQITWTRPANVVPGWVLDTGHVRAVEVRQADGRPPQLLPWQHTRWHADGLHLAARQHDALTGLYDPHKHTPQPEPDPQPEPAPVQGVVVESGMYE